MAPVELDDETAKHEQYVLGQATLAMVIGATDLAIGTGHFAFGDQAKASAILGIPNTHSPRSLSAWAIPQVRSLHR